MPKITDPLDIGPMRIKNRFVAAPMVGALWSLEDGTPSDIFIDWVEQLARGGFGLIVTPATAINPYGMSFRHQPAIWSDRFTYRHNELVEAAHSYDAKIAIQLFHGGAISRRVSLDERYTDKTPRSPSPFAEAKEISEKKIEETINAFGEAAARAAEAGYDAIEYRLCHQDLVQQFLSPAFNQRKDKWGEDKTLFMKETFKAVKKNIPPHMALYVRVSLEEHIPPGEPERPRLLAEFTLKEVIPWLLKEGVHAISVTDGGVLNYYDLAFTIQPLYFSRGVIVDHADKVKKVVRELGYDIPVGTVGKLMDPKLCERLIEEGRVDFVKLGRVAWADPEFPKKTIEGRYEDIRTCISCDYCTYMLFLRLPCRCSVNWEFNRPFHQRKLEKTKEPKNIVVIGGGIAGMEFARVAKLRGHKVVLYEKRDRLGGLINIASDIPYVPTGDLRGIATYLEREIKKLGVEIHLGKEVDADFIKKIAPDIVVIATGSVSKIPDIPGVDLPHVLTIDQYLWEKPELEGENVVVLGDEEPAEVALSLARQEKKVTIISEKKPI